MNKQQVEVWEFEHAVDVGAPAEIVWTLFEDVASWSRWNRGVASAVIEGPFAAGSSVTMRLPTGEELASRLVEVRKNAGFLDETQVGTTRVFVDHRIEPTDSENCRVVLSLEAFGAGCDEIGPMACADFPEVLQSLARRAETLSCADA